MGQFIAFSRFHQVVDLSINTVFSDEIFFYSSKKGALSDPYYYSKANIELDYIDTLDLTFTLTYIKATELIGGINQQLKRQTIQSWADLCDWTPEQIGTYI